MSWTRFIPTYVGHTLKALSRAPKPAVHPHIRGAYRSDFWGGEMMDGSSPHTWGIHAVLAGHGLQNRFIPTYVGHTQNLPHPVETLAVHPHIRGAYVRPPLSSDMVSGSSPHTWGIQLSSRGWPRSRRFIPTYVGHTEESQNQALRCTVHPHIRGAYTGPP